MRLVKYRFSSIFITESKYYFLFLIVHNSLDIYINKYYILSIFCVFNAWERNEENVCVYNSPNGNKEQDGSTLSSYLTLKRLLPVHMRISGHMLLNNITTITIIFKWD